MSLFYSRFRIATMIGMLLASSVGELSQLGYCDAVEITAASEQSLLSQEALKDCRVHVIGIYTPSTGSRDDRVPVRIAATGHPMVVVLCSYMSTQWNVTIDEKADVQQIIVSGWFKSSLLLAKSKSDKSYPTKFVIGSRDAPVADPNYFWAYGWHSAEGRKVRDQVKALTGHTVSTFQGIYQGKSFVIDGKQGELSKDATEVIKTDDATYPAKNELLLVAAEKLSDDDRQDPRLVEKFVRQLFELETQQKAERIKKAEEDLKRIKEKFAKRQENAEQIIKTQIAALTPKKSEATPKQPSESVPANNSGMDPLIEGWQLWNQQKWSAALPRFEEAVKLYPDKSTSWNGLGWTQIHLGRYDAAIKSFEKTLQLDKKEFGAYNGRGRALMALGKLDEAEKDLLEGTLAVIQEFGETNAIQSGITAPWYGLVEVNILQKDYATAREWVDRYLKVKPDDQGMKRLSGLIKPAQ